jgi:hypothetical protein
LEANDVAKTGLLEDHTQFIHECGQEFRFNVFITVGDPLVLVRI